MIAALKKLSVRYGLAALLLTGVLATMVVQRIQHLRHGREIVLNIRPVDPRDLFKGDYVRLGFDISRPKPELLKTAPERKARTVHVLMDPGLVSGDWTIVSISPTRPTPAANQVVLRAVLTSGMLRYGIERYFVPEGTGLALEDQARTGKLAAIVAVDRQGRMAIKGLIHDGKTIHRESLL